MDISIHFKYLIYYKNKSKKNIQYIIILYYFILLRTIFVIIKHKICVLIISAFKKFIKRSLTTLKYDVENIRMDVFESILEKIDDKLSGKSNGFAETYATHEDITIIENDTDLNQMENRLVNDSLYRSSVVCSL